MYKVNLLRTFIRQRPRMRLLFPLIWTLMSLLMLTSFMILQFNVQKIEVLGKVSSDHNWLRNANYLVSFVLPDQQTSLLMPPEQFISNYKQRDDIICFVISAPKNRQARSAIRRTWGKQLKPLFVMGRSDNATMNFVMNEAKVFNDIIVEDFLDSYMNLTIKTAFAMKNFLQLFGNSKLFLKIDDDVFFNTEKLPQMLGLGNVILGRLGESQKPHRDKENKWYVPRWMYAAERFPAYIDGPAYIIPGSMVERIFETAMRVPFFTLEDVFFSGYVAKDTLGFNLHNSKLFRTKKAPYFHPCLFE